MNNNMNALNNNISRFGNNAAKTHRNKLTRWRFSKTLNNNNNSLVRRTRRNAKGVKRTGLSKPQLKKYIEHRLKKIDQEIHRLDPGNRNNPYNMYMTSNQYRKTYKARNNAISNLYGEKRQLKSELENYELL